MNKTNFKDFYLFIEINNKRILIKLLNYLLRFAIYIKEEKTKVWRFILITVKNYWVEE